ncbi:MAG: prepilin-type N-terminal cleavage/methylation domain-containing protein [Candidatus Staskawiczbacteria bacterium]|nr:prepilin-type N-terminal cleavage/methylation domain-containing protein [Candidatus Staskawiczbacteria bacterium]
MQKQRGFSIIELIVVIAIIAVLASIVMVSVTVYINKAKIATVQADMHQLQTLAGIYASKSTDSDIYAGFCISPAVTQILDAIKKVDPKYDGIMCADISSSYFTGPSGTNTGLGSPGCVGKWIVGLQNIGTPSGCMCSSGGSRGGINNGVCTTFNNVFSSCYCEQI